MTLTLGLMHSFLLNAFFHTHSTPELEFTNVNLRSPAEVPERTAATLTKAARPRIYAVFPIQRRYALIGTPAIASLEPAQCFDSTRFIPLTCTHPPAGSLYWGLQQGRGV